MVKEFKDESGISNLLKAKIAKAQYDPEPTREQYLNPIPLNLRRSENVMAQQKPVDQTMDKDTSYADSKKMAEKAFAEAKAEYQRMKVKDREEPGFMKELFKMMPTPAQLRMASALTQGNLGKFAMALESSYKERDREKDKKEQAAKKKITKLERKLAKQKKEEEERKVKKSNVKKTLK